MDAMWHPSAVSIYKQVTHEDHILKTYPRVAKL